MTVGGSFTCSITRKGTEVIAPPHNPPDTVVSARTNGGGERVGTIPLCRRLVRGDGGPFTAGKCPGDLTVQDSYQTVRTRPDGQENGKGLKNAKAEDGCGGDE